MKDSKISLEDYQNVKKFNTLLKLSNLGELNKLYNLQDTIILCNIFEQRSDLLKQIFQSEKNVIVPVAFLGLYIVTKASAVLLYQMMQIL